MLALRHEFQSRLRSTGGRPSDPSWTVSRQVPFKEESWAQLKEIAERVGTDGPRVGPAQVAALLIEGQLGTGAGLEWAEVLRESRSAPLLDQEAAASAAHVSYNQFDDWVAKQWLVAARRTGRRLSFSNDEVIRATWLRQVFERLADAPALAPRVRLCDLSLRYIVVTSSANVVGVASPSALLRVVERDGAVLVFDQLQERLRHIAPNPPAEREDQNEPLRHVV